MLFDGVTASPAVGTGAAPRPRWPRAGCSVAGLHAAYQAALTELRARAGDDAITAYFTA